MWGKERLLLFAFTGDHGKKRKLATVHVYMGIMGGKERLLLFAFTRGHGRKRTLAIVCVYRGSWEEAIAHYWVLSQWVIRDKEHLLSWGMVIIRIKLHLLSSAFVASMREKRTLANLCFCKEVWGRGGGGVMRVEWRLLLSAFVGEKERMLLTAFKVVMRGKEHLLSSAFTGILRGKQQQLLNVCLGGNERKRTVTVLDGCLWRGWGKKEKSSCWVFVWEVAMDTADVGSLWQVVWEITRGTGQQLFTYFSPFQHICFWSVY